jgi:DNA-binding CsgD family transcriptional regulator
MSRPANRPLRRASRRKWPPEVHRARGPKAPLSKPRVPAAAAEAGTPAPAPRQQLSRREREIVALLIAGRSVKEAAAALGLSPRTVEDYLARLKRRFRQPRLLSLVVHLVKRGLDL